MRKLCRPFVLCALLGAAACGDSTPPTPPTPTPDAPTLSCPASASLVSPDGAAVPLTFTVPTAVGGQLPVPVTCSKLSGSAFPLGSTIVTCTAVDALARQASCNFAVTVTAAPRISKTRFLAFGDSITFGRCGPKDGVPNTCPPYAVRLEELLRARYTLQTFAIATQGVPGETAPEGEDRLPGVLSTYNPEVLLLMEGTNDLNNGASNIPEALESLEDMIDLARSRGITVFLATIPPIAPGGPNSGTIPLVGPFNDEIRNLAGRKSVRLVEVYDALKADVPRYYVGDDLHPTAEGLRLIGETFYAAIRATLDNTPTASAPSFAPARPGLGGHGLQPVPTRPGLKPGTSVRQ